MSEEEDNVRPPANYIVGASNFARPSPRYPTLAEANERRRLLIQSRITVAARFCFALFCIGLISAFVPHMGAEAKWSMIVGGTGFIACCLHFIFTDPDTDA
jgi:hypothetical protein